VEVGGNGRGAPCNSHEAAGGWNGGYAGLVGGCNQYGTLAWPGFSGGGATDIRTATLGSGIPLTGVRATDPRLLVAGGGGSMDLTFGAGTPACRPATCSTATAPTGRPRTATATA
jgi:hypothetical protein